MKSDCVMPNFMQKNRATHGTFRVRRLEHPIDIPFLVLQLPSATTHGRSPLPNFKSVCFLHLENKGIVFLLNRPWLW